MSPLHTSLPQVGWSSVLLGFFWKELLTVWIDRPLVQNPPGGRNQKSPKNQKKRRDKERECMKVNSDFKRVRYHWIPKETGGKGDRFRALYRPPLRRPVSTNPLSHWRFLPLGIMISQNTPYYASPHPTVSGSQSPDTMVPVSRCSHLADFFRMSVTKLNSVRMSSLS